MPHAACKQQPPECEVRTWLHESAQQSRVGLLRAMATVNVIALQQAIVQSARKIAPLTLGIAKRCCCNGSRSLGSCSRPTSDNRSSINSTSSCRRRNISSTSISGRSRHDRERFGRSAAEEVNRRPVEEALVVGGGIAGGYYYCV